LKLVCSKDKNTAKGNDWSNVEKKYGAIQVGWRREKCWKKKKG